MTRRRRSWSSCYHEAGHAVAIWSTGYRFAYVAVQPCGALEPDVGGHVWCAPFITCPRFMSRQKALELADDPTQLDAVLNIARIDLFVSMAGPAAEARYRRCSIDHAILNGGESDMKAYGDVVEAWFPDERIATWDRTLERCRKFVRSAPRHWIKAVAAALYADGVLSFDEVDAICGDIWPRWLKHQHNQIKCELPLVPPKAPHPDRWAAAQLRLDL